MCVLIAIGVGGGRKGFRGCGNAPSMVTEVSASGTLRALGSRGRVHGLQAARDLFTVSGLLG